MATQNRKKAIRWAAEIILLLTLFVLSGMLFHATSDLQGTARIINYAGIIRGGTQRLVKLECIGQANLELEAYLDEILVALRDEDERDSRQLIALPDPDYQENLAALSDQWLLVKQELIQVRQMGYQTTNIVPLSERHFELADVTVSSAEQYAQGIASKINTLEYSLSITIVLLAGLTLSQYWKALKEARVSRILATKANIDAHTGLPNKNRCEVLINRQEPITEPLCVLVFDLNNLKFVNDRFGHTVGDEMIRVFAYLLRDAFRDDDFVGRCGGDEFLVIARLSSEEQLARPIEKLWASIMQYNAEQEQIALSFAYGAAFSCDCGRCTLRRLFDQADQKMYEQKRQMKATAPDQSGQVH